MTLESLILSFLESGPKNIEEIFQHAKEHYPKTRRASIRGRLSELCAWEPVKVERYVSEVDCVRYFKLCSTISVSSQVVEGVGALPEPQAAPAPKTIKIPTFDELRRLFRETGFCQHKPEHYKVSNVCGNKITDCGICGHRISKELVCV